MKFSNLLLALGHMRWSTLFVFGSLTLLGITAVSMLPSAKRPDGAVSEVRQNNQELLYERVEFLKASILSPQNLDEIITDMALGSIEESGSREDILNRLVIDIENLPVVNRYTGKLGLQPLAITVQYNGRTAEEAQAVASTITNQILLESRGRDLDTGRSRATYLDNEVSKASINLAEIEDRIAKFKSENSLMMPELNNLYIRQYEDNKGTLERSRALIADLERRAAQTELEIAATSREALLMSEDGTRIESTGERLERARVALATARSRYSSEHPSVKALMRDIEALELMNEGGDTASLELELKNTSESLAIARERYTEVHPTVQGLEKQVEEISSRLLLAQSSSPPPVSTSAPSSPAYNRLIVNREAISASIARERLRTAELESEAIVLNERFANMPAIEGQYLVLQRELEDQQDNYEALQKARSTASLDSGLRESELLESLTLVASPEVPISPSSPNRKLLSMLAVLFAFATALTLTLGRIFLGERIFEVNPDRLGSENVMVHSIPKF